MRSILLLACLISAGAVLAQTSVRSKGQRGGVTAGTIGRVDIKNIRTYVTASDLAPSLETSLKAISIQPDVRSVYLVFRNPTAKPINVITVKYQGKGNLNGLQKSFGTQVVRPKASIEVKLFSGPASDNLELATDVLFAGSGPKSSKRAFHEIYILEPGELSASKLPTQSSLVSPTSVKFDELIGSQEEIARPKGEYVFTLPATVDGSFHGGIDAFHRFFVFDSEHQWIGYAIQYSGFTNCWLAPLLPRKGGVHRIRMFWDDMAEKAGLTVDGIEVTNETSVTARIPGVRCDNAVTPKRYDEVMKIWDERAADRAR